MIVNPGSLPSPMQSFLDNFLHSAFRCFRHHQNGKQRLCELRDLDFQAGHSPDYSNPWVQSLYLMRYFYAYFTDYYYLYRKIIPWLSNATPKVISIGCGCGVDGAALCFASSPIGNFQYNGYDIVNWDLDVRSFLPLYSAQINLYKADITTTTFPKSNVLMFPKSLSDIDNDIFSAFVHRISPVFLENRVVILSSIMNDGNEYDVAKMEGIVSQMQAIGYDLKVGSTDSIPFADPGACCNHIDNAKFPDKIKDFIATLDDQCSIHDENCQACTVARNPILTTHLSRFQGLGFEREYL